MRALFLSWNALNDPGSGAARSFRTSAAWLAEAGHDVVALCGAGFEGLAQVDLSQHLGHLGVSSPGRFLPKSRNLARYPWHDVAVNMVCTATGRTQNPDPADVASFVAHIHRIVREHRPQVTVCYGHHRATYEGMRLCRKGGSRTVFTLYNFGYEQRQTYQHVDRVLVDSAFLGMYYQQQIGLRSFAISGPIEPGEVIVDEHVGDSVVFVNPVPIKGSCLVATLAEMLCERRPDIKLRVICSTSNKEVFTQMLSDKTAEWVDFSGPYDSPKDWLKYARFLLVPSLAEALGRVCIEAMINGIPCIGVDHGGVPEAMCGTGVNLTIPKRLAKDPETPVPVEEAEDWYAEIVKMWDNKEEYEIHRRRCLQVAETKWTKEAQMARLLSYYEAVAAGK